MITLPCNESLTDLMEKIKSFDLGMVDFLTSLLAVILFTLWLGYLLREPMFI